MTQEDKELLLKDLCGRLPYGVKLQCNSNGMMCIGPYTLDTIVLDRCFNEHTEYVPFDEFKPYLFPLSSMTEEQKKDISKRYNLHTSYGLCIEITNHSEGYWDDDNSCHLQDYLWLVDWFNKNHFDFRNLIGRNLAIDCTSFNVF